MKSRKDLILELEEQYIQTKSQIETIANDTLNYFMEIYPDFARLHKLKKEVEFNIMKFRCSCAERNQNITNKLSSQLNDINQAYFDIVKNYNIDITRFEPKYNCPICKDTGYVGKRMCACFKRQLNKRLNKQNITRPLATWNDSINLDVERNKIQQTLKTWSNQYPNTNISNILLLGTPGTGKTFDLECITSDLVSNDISVIFVTAFEFNEQCRKYHCGQENIVDDFLKIDVLIIDDLGSEPMLNNVTVEYLYNIIDVRQRYTRATLISSNLGLNTLLTRYGERIFSRLNNRNIGLTIKLSGDDLRRRNLKEEK